ncbi:MAG: hypothetical protein PHI23_02080, partial [Candidatus Peribacteraceae bacterium]|nr:hypothetical protein [Candidatus Peribacteraceae bacterium]
YPRSGWREEGTEKGTTEEALQKLRERVREETLPKEDDENAFPYFLRGNDLLPSSDVPGPVDLNPFTEASSSAS